MKTLQLWFSHNSDPVKPYMESVINHTPHAEHYFIGPQSASVKGQIALDYKDELEKAYVNLGNKAWWDKYTTENMFVADMLRLSWAIDNPDLLYVDADVEFVLQPKLPKQTELPAMGINNNIGIAEFFLFYVNGCEDWFKRLIHETIYSPFEKFAFMKTFHRIQKGMCIKRPFTWQIDTFYIRHN